MEIVHYSIAVLLMHSAFDCHDQAFGMSPCLALSFDESQEVAHCSTDHRCPSDSSYCYLMNPQSSYGTCCLGCGRRASEPTTSCTSDAGCSSGDSGVRVRCRRPNNKPDALGVCCEITGGY